MVSDGSREFIYFKVDGNEYTLSFRQIEALFEFREGVGQEPSFDAGELIKLWNTLGGSETFKTSRVKSSDIRNPALRYFHRVIASTIFGKKNLGKVNDQELQVIDSAFKDFLLYASPEDMDEGITMKGDMNGAGNAAVLVASLTYIKTYAYRLHRQNKEGDISIGGVVTPFLIACGIDLSTSNWTEPLWLDIPHLQSSKILNQTMVGDQYVYNFQHPLVERAKILLPFNGLPKITEGESINFVPPPNLLFRTRARRENQQVEIEEKEGIPEPERYDFGEESCGTLKEVSKKLTLSQRWSKWQDKTIKKLSGKVRELATAVKDLTSSVKDIQRNQRGSPPTIPP